MIEWKDDVYSVGITAMDDQHKVLIGLINALEKHRWNPNKDFQEKVPRKSSEHSFRLYQ